MRIDSPDEDDGATAVDRHSPIVERDTLTADRGSVEDSDAARTAYSVEYRALVEAEYRAAYGTFDGIVDTVKAVAEDAVEPTGARGIASGRDFDPEAAGGPIQRLDAGGANITGERVRAAAAHLQRFAGSGTLEAPEQGMLDRLASIAAGDMDPTSYDLNFYTHELDEAGRYAQLGYGPESGVDLGSPEMYDVWNNVHTAALEDYGISGADLFYRGLAP